MFHGGFFPPALWHYHSATMTIPSVRKVASGCHFIAGLPKASVAVDSGGYGGISKARRKAVRFGVCVCETDSTAKWSSLKSMLPATNPRTQINGLDFSENPRMVLRGRGNQDSSEAIGTCRLKLWNEKHTLEYWICAKRAKTYFVSYVIWLFKSVIRVVLQGHLEVEGDSKT